MSEQVGVVSRFLEGLASDLDVASALVAEAAVIDEAPSLPFGGERKGPDGLRAMIGDLQKDFRVQLRDQAVHDAGAMVVVTLTVRLESRRSGRTVEMAVVDLYTVEDGLITRLDVFYKDTNAVVDIHGS